MGLIFNILDRSTRLCFLSTYISYKVFGDVYMHEILVSTLFLSRMCGKFY